MQIQPIEITQIIVAIITAIGAIIAARQRRTQRESPEPEGKPRRIRTWTIMIGVCLILLAANLGVFGWRYWGSTTEVEITYPHDGANVGDIEMVLGTSQKIPKGQAIWIIVYPPLVDLYLPQNNSADVQVNGDWASLTSFGTYRDIFNRMAFDIRTFNIIAVLADKRAQDAFNTYFKQAKDMTTLPGLERLPEGTTIYDRIMKTLPGLERLPEGTTIYDRITVTVW